MSISAESYAACNGKTFAVDYQLTGDADLSSDYIRFELIDPLTLKSIQLDSTRFKAGKINLKLPANLTGNFYRLRGTFKKAELSSEFDFAMTKPAEIIISGNTVINSGEETQLVLQSKNTVAEIVNYQLSDGTKGIYYAPGDAFIPVSPNQTTTYTDHCYCKYLWYWKRNRQRNSGSKFTGRPNGERNRRPFFWGSPFASEIQFMSISTKPAHSAVET